MEMDPLRMYFLSKMGIFHCYVSLPEGNQLIVGKLPDFQTSRGSHVCLSELGMISGLACAKSGEVVASSIIGLNNVESFNLVFRQVQG